MNKSIALSKRRGFTLIELSIVLVIIGLIVGGVLMGKSLITAAQLRNVLNEMDAFQGAITTFKIKYNCIPGDCPNAIALGVGTRNGNGNGVIDGMQSGKQYIIGTNGDDGILEEASLVWQELALAKLVAFPSYDPTATASKNDGVDCKIIMGRSCMVAIGYSGVNYIRFGAMHAAAGNNTVRMNIRNTLWPEEAYSLDAKVDDGFPYSGSFNNWIQFDTRGWHYFGCDFWDAVNGGQNIYNVTLATNSVLAGAPIVSPPCTVTVPMKM